MGGIWREHEQNLLAVRKQSYPLRHCVYVVFININYFLAQSQFTLYFPST